MLAAVAGLGVTLFPGPLSTPATPRAGTSPAATVQFSDVTKKAGIDFAHFKGTLGTSTILEEAGPGVCVADLTATATRTSTS